MSYPDDKLELLVVDKLSSNDQRESEEQLQKIACEEDNLHDFEGEQTCNSCGISYNEAHADDYDEGER